MLDANPLQAHLNLPLLWCHLPPVISSPLISSRRGSVQVLAEGVCFQEGTKCQLQLCVLEGLTPRPLPFSLAANHGTKAWLLHAPGVLSVPAGTCQVIYLFFTHCSLCRDVVPCTWAPTFPAVWDTLPPVTVLPLDAIKKPGPVASTVLYLIPAVLQVLFMKSPSLPQGHGSSVVPDASRAWRLPWDMPHLVLMQV